ncbi:MAG: SBBP repeat-containing protein [Promethearchaeota archaeon]
MNQRILARFTLLLLLSLLIPASLVNYPGIEEKHTKNREPPSDETPILSPELKSQVEKTLQGFMGGFVENKGQKNEAIHYYTESYQMAVGFGTSELHFTISHPSPARHRPVDSLAERSVETRKTYTSFTLTFRGSNQVNPVAYEPTGVYCNYFIGSNPTEWSINSQYYTKLIYHNLYEQIDLVYELKEGQLKYEFFVHPGSRLEDIKLQWSGPVSLEILEQGMKVKVQRKNRLEGEFIPVFSFVDTVPIAYQSPTRDHPLTGSFELLEPTTYGFSVPTYDPTKLLIIDPFFLTYSTYISGSNHDFGYDIALDAAGNAYVTGFTLSTDFPTVNAYTGDGGGEDVFVCKLATNGSTLLYSTYVSGNSDERSFEIAVDAAGNAYVMGRTSSTNFPTTPGAFNETYNGGQDVFVCKLAVNGSTLLYSTYLGGSNLEDGRDMAVDVMGNVYVTGDTYSTNFPTTPGAIDETYNGGQDAFVCKLTANGSTLLYSTYLGGSAVEGSRDIAIAIDDAGNAYVTGDTSSTDFPTVNAYDATGDGSISYYDVFVCKLAANGSTLLYSTYVSGSDHDHGYEIALDAAGNAYVTGRTDSTDFPTVNAYMGDIGSRDVFVFKLAVNGSTLLYSTYLGGSAVEEGMDIAVDVMGNAYVTGETWSTNFPTTPDAINATGGGVGTSYYDVFVCKLAANGSNLLYSTYVSGSQADRGHGIAVDSMGNAYVTGYTSSTDFPTVNAYMGNGGGEDVFVTKLGVDDLSPAITLNNPTNNSVHQSGTLIKLNITDTDSGLGQVVYNWDSSTNIILEAPFDVTLPAGEGAHVLWIYANDSVGNWAMKTFVFITDDIAPIIALLSPTNGSTHSSGTPIGIIIEDAKPLSQILYHWDNNPNVTLTDLIITVFLPAGDGLHVLYVYAQDQVGNWATRSYIFTTDDTSLTTSTSTTTIITTSTTSSSPVTNPGFEIVGLFLALTVLVLAPVLYKRRRKL